MQLAYSIWNEIERRVLAKKGCSNESIKAYKKRLNLTTKKLPRTQVKKILLKMKSNLPPAFRFVLPVRACVPHRIALPLFGRLLCI